MPTLYLLIGLAASAGVTALLIPPLRYLAIRYGWVDEPDGDRKLHREPIPIVGGIAIAIGFVATLAAAYSFQSELPFELPAAPVGLWFAAILMVLVGAVDDIRGLGFKQKLFFQIVAAFALVHAGFRIDLSGISFLAGDAYIMTLYSSALTILWIVGVINAVNLLDGLDGLAAGVAMIGFTALAVIFGIEGQVGLIVPAVIVVGALAGFLYHNFNPANIFMGDSGSLLLGVLLAVYALESQGHADPVIGLLVPVVALGLPILDTNLSIVRRFASRRAIFAPDRDHIHHRLLLRYSPRASVLILYGAAATFGTMAILVKTMPPRVGYILLLGTLVASAAGVYAMGYIAARPLLYELGRRLLGAESLDGSDIQLSHIPSTEGTPDQQQSSAVKNTLTESAENKSLSSGDGALRTAIPVLAFNELSDMLSNTSVVVAADGLTEADLGDESVILDLNSGSYFGLNEVGARVFRMIKEPISVGSIVETLTGEYDVAPERLKADILDFLRMMREKELIKVLHGKAA